jgi:CRISPR-associated protein (TIGR02710 family)
MGEEQEVMEGSFEELEQRWQRIRAGEEVYIEGHASHEQARAFHADHIAPITLEHVRQSYLKRRGERRIDVLVSMVGLSPATSITAAYVLRPEHLVLVYTRESLGGVDAICDALIAEHRLLKFSQITKRLCQASDPVDIYRVIKESIDEAAITLERDEGIDYIDITGGKKVMSAAAALVAWQLGLNICYTDSRFDKLTRTPFPGSEEFKQLGNPLEIFGEQEIKVATELFNGGNHTAAAEQFRQLSKRIRTSEQVRFYATLSRFYADWCAFRFDEMAEHIPHLTSDIAAGRAGLTSAQATRLAFQFEHLDRLRSRDNLDERLLLVDYILLADHYFNHDRREFAAMLYYRAFEAAASYRLATAFDIDASVPNYEQWETSRFERFITLSREVYRVSDSVDFTPSPQLSFMASILALAAHEEAMGEKREGIGLMERAELHKIGLLKGLQSIATIRNASILAHGSTPIPSGDLSRLARNAHRFVEAVWDESAPALPFARTLEALRFLEL